MGSGDCGHGYDSSFSYFYYDSDKTESKLTIPDNTIDDEYVSPIMTNLLLCTTENKCGYISWNDQQDYDESFKRIIRPGKGVISDFFWPYFLFISFQSGLQRFGNHRSR